MLKLKIKPQYLCPCQNVLVMTVAITSVQFLRSAGGGSSRQAWHLQILTACYVQ